jgi:hypothetical protein
MKEMHVLYEQMLLQQRQEKCPPAIHPELSSLIDYLNENNLSTIYGPAANFKFLWNILSSKIPPHSTFWHPQSFTEWCEAQPGNSLFGVLLALLGRLIDSGLAKRISRKYKVNPSKWGNVKMTQVSLFFSVTLNTLSQPQIKA